MNDYFLGARCMLRQMTTTKQSTAEDQADQKVLEKEISELRSAREVLSERAKPVNEELEKILQRERECVDRLQHLAAQTRERKRLQTFQCDIHLGPELANCENDKRFDGANRWKNAAHRVTRRPNAPQLQRRAEHENDATATAAGRGLATGPVGELQKQLKLTTKLLNKTREELYKTRQRLSDVQERLTVAEQVTAATQQRALQESDNSDELQLELASQHAGWRLHFL